MGDFNFHIIERPSASVSENTTEEQKQVNCLLRFAEELLLEQIVKPTRKSNILDLVLLNNIDRIHSHHVVKTLISDRYFVEILLDNYGQETRKHQFFVTLTSIVKKTNWEALNRELAEIDWAL